MGILSRMSTILRAKFNELLDRAEDPRQTLDYSYERQLELLRDVKRGLVDVTASRRRLEIQAAKLRGELDRLDEQTRQAVADGREDLARLAPQRKELARTQLEGLDEQLAQLEAEEQKLAMAEQRLHAKVQAFRTKKEMIEAQKPAAEAQVRIGEAVSGVSEEMADVSLAIDRAQDRTEAMRARASAIDELVATGVLEDVTEGDALGRELQRISMEKNVEADLERLRAELGPGAAPRQLRAGQ